LAVAALDATGIQTQALLQTLGVVEAPEQSLVTVQTAQVAVAVALPRQVQRQALDAQVAMAS
jgi:hypothetical protein